MSNDPKADKTQLPLPEWIEDWLMEELTEAEIDAALRADGHDPETVGREARELAFRTLSLERSADFSNREAGNASGSNVYALPLKATGLDEQQEAPPLGLAASRVPIKVVSGVVPVGPIALAGRQYELFVFAETGDVVLRGEFDAGWTAIFVGDDRRELLPTDAEDMRLCENLGRTRIETALEDGIVIEFK
jgi:hypothetical protein